jgi:hypothetical protein
VDADEDGGEQEMESVGSKRSLPEQHRSINLETFIARPITTRIDESEIKALAVFRPQVKAEIERLDLELKASNPNVEIIKQYRDRKRDHDLKL